jgi:hypothetical protein
MKLIWSHKDSIMTCTGRQRQRERWWQGRLQVSWSTGENVTQHENNIDTANLEVHCNRLSPCDFLRHRRTDGIMKEIHVNTSSAEESSYKGIIVF